MCPAGPSAVWFKKLLESTAGARADEVGVVNQATGLIGLSSVLVVWLGIPLLALTPASWGWLHEAFALPNQRQLIGVCVNAALSFFFNVSFLLAVALTSPLAVSISCVAAIPASALTDWWLHHGRVGGGMAAGSALILTGFLTLVWAERREKLAAAAAAAASTTDA